MWFFGKRFGAKESVPENLIGDYMLGATIGRGSFGVVKSAQRIFLEDKVAIKIVSTARSNNDKLLTEIRNHRRMKHPHVVQVHDVFECDANMHIVMELVTGGDLFDYIVKSHPRLPELDARRLFQQIVAGVEHCHARGVVHRDLKPENIFMDANGNVKIGDFGLSGEMRAGVLLTESCGSPNYAAPELLYKGCQYDGPEVDVWSLGIILYTLLCSSLPFDAPTLPKLFNRIKSGRYSVPGFVSREANSLIGRILVVDPAMRARMPEIRSHSWFQKDLSPELVETKTPSLPNLFQNAKTMGNTMEASQCRGVSSSHASLEKATYVDQSDTPQRCATSSTLAPVLTTTSESTTPLDTPSSSPRLDIPSNPVDYSRTGGYSIESAMYIFTNQLVF